jgi:hypothetical protein
MNPRDSDQDVDGVDSGDGDHFSRRLNPLPDRRFGQTSLKCQALYRNTASITMLVTRREPLLAVSAAPAATKTLAISSENTAIDSRHRRL